LRRDLERRLRAVEARWFVSARAAAILRAFDGGFEVEPRAQTPAEFTGIFDPRTLTDAELDYLIAEVEARIAESAGSRSP
jgi:hypothetical protein